MTIKNRLETETATFIFTAYNERTRKTRVSVSVEEDEILAATGLVRPPYGSSRGDGSEGDKAWKKYNRAELTLMRKKAEALLAEAGVKYEKMYWSRTAGCGCGCSPAFILDRIVYRESEAGYQRSVDYIFPTHKPAEPVAEVEAPKGADAIKAAIESLTPPALPTVPKGADAIKAAIAAA